MIISKSEYKNLTEQLKEQESNINSMTTKIRMQGAITTDLQTINSDLERRLIEMQEEVDLARHLEEDYNELRKINNEQAALIRKYEGKAISNQQLYKMNQVNEDIIRELNLELESERDINQKQKNQIDKQLKIIKKLKTIPSPQSKKSCPLKKLKHMVHDLFN